MQDALDGRALLLKARRDRARRVARLAAERKSRWRERALLRQRKLTWAWSRSESGLIPGAGGCKELVRRIVSPAMRLANARPTAISATGAPNDCDGEGLNERGGGSRSLGFLTDADQIVMNRDHQIAEAKRLVLDLADVGYRRARAGQDLLRGGTRRARGTPCGSLRHAAGRLHE